MRQLAAACVLAALAGACTGSSGDTALPPKPETSAAAASTSLPAATPAPIDKEAAVPDPDAGRSASPAQGSVAFRVRGPGPGGAGGQAYVGWVRASLTAFARPGKDDGGVERFAAPPVVRDVREGCGSWCCGAGPSTARPSCPACPSP